MSAGMQNLPCLPGLHTQKTSNSTGTAKNDISKTSAKTQKSKKQKPLPKIPYQTIPILDMSPSTNAVDSIISLHLTIRNNCGDFLYTIICNRTLLINCSETIREKFIESDLHENEVNSWNYDYNFEFGQEFLYEFINLLNEIDKNVRNSKTSSSKLMFDLENIPVEVTKKLGEVLKKPQYTSKILMFKLIADQLKINIVSELIKYNASKIIPQQIEATEQAKKVTRRKTSKSSGKNSQSKSSIKPRLGRGTGKSDYSVELMVVILSILLFSLFYYSCYTTLCVLFFIFIILKLCF